ncbi:MAG: hypothetical protein WC588_00110 [Candidatus Micrarchaeia archaeon]
MARINQKLAHDYTDAVFVGVGGCGMNTVSRLRKAGVKGTRTICISRLTEEQKVEGNDVNRIVLLGTEADPVCYRLSKAPISSDERAAAEIKIQEALGGAKKVLLFAGLGGFTGTAIVPVVAAMAKGEAATLGMVITYPFRLERHRREVAEKALPSLSGLADDFMLRKNDDLVDRCPKMPMNEAFGLFDMEIAKEIKMEGARNEE